MPAPLFRHDAGLTTTRVVSLCVDQPGYRDWMVHQTSRPWRRCRCSVAHRFRVRATLVVNQDPSRPNRQTRSATMHEETRQGGQADGHRRMGPRWNNRGPCRPSTHLPQHTGAPGDRVKVQPHGRVLLAELHAEPLLSLDQVAHHRGERDARAPPLTLPHSTQHNTRHPEENSRKIAAWTLDQPGQCSRPKRESGESCCCCCLCWWCC